MPVEATSSKRTRSIAHVEILAVLFAVGIKSTSGLVSLPGSALGRRLRLAPDPIPNEWLGKET